MSKFLRRSFLQGLVVTVAASPLAGCGDDTDTTPDGPSTDPADQARVFPQGLASGDPKETSVILWVRVDPENEAGPITVKYEVSKTADFASLVASGELSASEEYDFTLRLKVTELDSFTTYYYRFVARDVQSITGRTKTAPAADQDVNARFAFASCQDFVGRYYHSWKALAEEPDVDFVLYLGDYIYETNGDPDFQTISEDRAIEIPDGIQLEPVDAPNALAASTLADYRGIYRQYRSDPNLQKIHSLYPFICLWDDHEFANDCWQDHSTDFNEAQGDEKNPARRHAASQAWFEFQPADVEFTASASPPNDIKIYRTLRYGKHVEIFITDQRSYRDDHVIPEGALGNERPAGAPDTVPTYDQVGKIDVFQYSEVFTRNFMKKPAFDQIEAFVQPTMLGAEQKSWFINAVTTSNATWKFWANETQLAEMILDLTSFNIPDSFKGIYYFTADQWDGYRSERAEVLQALAGTTNLVALTGDIHAFYASEIHVDPAVLTDEPVCVEYVCAGISSSPAQEITQSVVDSNVAFTALKSLVPQFDTILRNTSPEYKYADSLSHGLAIVEVKGNTEITVEFLVVRDVKSKNWDGTVERVKFRTASGSPRVEAL